MQLRTLASVGALLSPLAVAQEGQVGDAVWFEEVGLELGVEWEHVSGQRADRHWFPEIMGGGAALLDFDGDGDLDLYLVQSGRLDPLENEIAPTNKLFRNDLAESGKFVDVTAQTKVGSAAYGMGAACGDFDQDGDVDLYITNVGQDTLYQNDGKGRFRDVSSRYVRPAGDGSWGTSAGFLDADLDGDLDLFVVNNLNWEASIETYCVNYRSQPDFCSPENYNAHSADRLYMLGRLGLQDYGQRLGLDSAPANGLGVCIADYDRDGDLDVYVANDATPNCLWRNDGGKRLGKAGAATLENVAPRSGCAVNMQGTPEAGMGVQWVDLDQDGWLDLYMTHLRRESNTFYKNNRRGRFRDMTRSMGIAADSLKFTGFGVGFHDFDHDGNLDLYIANGAVQAWGPDEAFHAEDAYAEPNQLFRGTGNARFDGLGEGVSAPMIATSRGSAYGDLDNDGDVDVVVVDRDARVKILRNIAPKQGGWVGLRLVNATGADALGALAKLTTSWTDDQGTKHTQAHWRLAHPAYSYLCSNDPRVHFGVPEGHALEALEVIWPGATELTAVSLPETGLYTTVRQD